MSVTTSRIAWQGFRFYLRPHLALALAVAAATAVLVGALVVGSSMRGSLRSLTLERLADIDEILIGSHFYRQALCDELRELPAFQTSYRRAEPAIVFPNGTVESTPDGQRRRTNQVNVLGIEPTFWQLQSAVPMEVLRDLTTGDQVVINRALANELGISDDQVSAGRAVVTLRIPKPTWMPGDSALGEKKELVSSLVDMQVAQIIENVQFGRFSLQPSQQLPLNLFLSLETLQEFLRRDNSVFRENPRLINATFLSGPAGTNPPSEKAANDLFAELTPRPEDLALKLKRIELAQGTGDQRRVIHEYLSLTTSRLVFSDPQVAALQEGLPSLKPASTYLINLIRKSGEPDAAMAIPYSMFTAIDFDDEFQPMGIQPADRITALADDQVVLSQWAAEDLGVQVGDEIELLFFEPESAHGVQREDSVTLRVAAIAALTEPDRPFAIRGNEVLTAEFVDPPTLVNDPWLTPEVPGLTDAVTMESWDVPFALTYRIRSQDDEYWNLHRTTPKGFVSLNTGLSLWNSRFGAITNFRLPSSVPEADVERELVSLWRESPGRFGLDIVRVKREGLAASAGTAPFDALFLGLSMFIIASALILVSLLFRLGLEQRVDQVGLLSALGWPQGLISRVWLKEIFLVCLLGGAVGLAGGVAYGALMIEALKTWWVGAIATPFLRLHVEPTVLAVGFLIGMAISLLTVAWGIRGMVRLPARELLRGIHSGNEQVAAGGSRIGWLSLTVVGLLLGAVVLVVVATGLGGESQAGAFMGGGFMFLAALWLVVFRQLKARNRKQGHLAIRSVGSLSWENLRRNPLRSTLMIGLVSVATFLIIAISSFRLQPTSQSTGGANWIAESSVPIVSDLGSANGRADLLGDAPFFPPTLDVYAWRLKPGQDASCNNLYQATQPRVLGVSGAWIERFDPPAPKKFLWSGVQSQSDTEADNPWRMLDRNPAATGTMTSPIPAILDKNTAMYSLKIYGTGGTYTVDYDSGEQVTFLIVGFLENSLFQGSLLIGENHFLRAFPNISGYQTLLITGEVTAEHEALIERLEERLGDYGLDARRSRDVLSGFAAVQNTYLSAFQSLGGLGLLLGTLGLGAVQLRNIVERRKELALMRAVGFGPRRLLALLFGEQLFLLLVGLVVGVLAALAATVPHWLVGQASLPWLHLALILGGVVICGLVSALLSARTVLRLPVGPTLKAG